MSLLNYFQRKDSKDEGIFLPEPQEGGELPKEVIESANAAVLALEIPPPAKRKPTTQHVYDAKTRADIGKYAAHHGPTAAVKHFTKVCGHRIPESTARKFRDAYVAELKMQACSHSGSVGVTSLPIKPKGRPLMLGDLDRSVQTYIKQLRATGGIINSDVVIAAAKGVVIAKNRSLLKEFGGHICIDKPWAKSLLTRMHYVKRRGSTSAKLPPADFEKVKMEYLEKIKKLVIDNRIVPQLVMNWDQTAIRLVPFSEWTMDKQGAKKISIKGLDDKREITALLTITLSGAMLPPQLLYGGKTERCHPDVDFPSDWDVWHTENHWSNESTVLRYIDKVINPYLESKRQELELPSNHRALLIMDVFRAHRCKSVLQKLADSNILVVYVPPNSTDQLQPLDLSVNKPIKSVMKSCFVQWYSERVTEQINAGAAIDEICIGLQMSLVKPLSGNWFINAFDHVSRNPDIILKGFRAAGILDILNMS